MKKGEENLSELWDTTKWSTIHIMEVPEEGQGKG